MIFNNLEVMVRFLKKLYWFFTLILITSSLTAYCAEDPERRRIDSLRRTQRQRSFMEHTRSRADVSSGNSSEGINHTSKLGDDPLRSIIEFLHPEEGRDFCESNRALHRFQEKYNIAVLTKTFEETPDNPFVDLSPFLSPYKFSRAYWCSKGDKKDFLSNPLKTIQRLLGNSENSEDEKLRKEISNKIFVLKPKESGDTQVNRLDPRLLFESDLLSNIATEGYGFYLKGEFTPSFALFRHFEETLKIRHFFLRDALAMSHPRLGLVGEIDPTILIYVVMTGQDIQENTQSIKSFFQLNPKVVPIIDLKRGDNLVTGEGIFIFNPVLLASGISSSGSRDLSCVFTNYAKDIVGLMIDTDRFRTFNNSEIRFSFNGSFISLKEIIDHMGTFCSEDCLKMSEIILNASDYESPYPPAYSALMRLLSDGGLDPTKRAGLMINFFSSRGYRTLPWQSSFYKTLTPMAISLIHADIIPSQRMLRLASNVFSHIEGDVLADVVRRIIPLLKDSDLDAGLGFFTTLLGRTDLAESIRREVAIAAAMRGGTLFDVAGEDHAQLARNVLRMDIGDEVHRRLSSRVSFLTFPQMRRIASQTKAELALEILKKNDSIVGHDYIEDSDVTSQVRAETAFNVLARAEHNLQTLVEIGKEFLSANRLIPGEDTKEVYHHMDKEWEIIGIPTLVHHFPFLEHFRVMQGKSVEEKMRSDGYRLLRADFHKELTGKALPLISAEGVSPQTRALLAMTILEKELEAPVHNDVATRSVNLISDDGVDPETSALLAQSILEANVEASLYILASGKSVRFINNLSVTPKTWKILALSLLKRRNILDPYLCFTVERWVNTFNRKPESEKFIEGLQRKYLQRFA